MSVNLSKFMRNNVSFFGLNDENLRQSHLQQPESKGCHISKHIFSLPFPLKKR